MLQVISQMSFVPAIFFTRIPWDQGLLSPAAARTAAS